MIKAILFDVDGVLLDSSKANEAFFRKLLVAAGYPAPTEKEYAQVFYLSMWDAIKELTKSTSEEEVRKIWELGKKIPPDFDLLKVPPHAEEVIKLLKKDYSLGIVSSRVKQSVDHFFKICNVKDCFDTIVAFEDTAQHKPHPEPLLTAVKRLGISPQEAVYIGDAPTDAQAAKAAGMPVIIYAGKNIKNADADIDSFEQIPERISHL